MTKGSFRKVNAKNIWNFPYIMGGASGGIIFHMFSATQK